jgi:hypothetical protein
MKTNGPPTEEDTAELNLRGGRLHRQGHRSRMRRMLTVIGLTAAATLVTAGMTMLYLAELAELQLKMVELQTELLEAERGLLRTQRTTTATLRSMLDKLNELEETDGETDEESDAESTEA